MALLLTGSLLLVVAGAAQPALDAARFEAALADPSIRHAAAIGAFYAVRSNQRVWTTGEGLSARGLALRTAIARADLDGLDPRRYALPAFNEDQVAERVEVAFSEALLRFSEDLARGQVDPGRVYRDWEATRRQFEPELILELAVTQGPDRALRAARPPHDAYVRLREALARYRAYAAQGGWPVIPPGPVFRVGDRDPALLLVKARLRLTGDLSATAPAAQDGFYDAVLEQAVRRAQARLGIAVDGAVGPATRRALNISPEERAHQIVLNMERWRWLPASLGATHLHINAADMALDYVRDGEPTRRLRTIVGTLGNPTPGFHSLITHAVFSPYWNVPESIAREEIRPRLASDPGYLVRHHMQVLSNGRIRQAPGPDNPLGPVKFIFENRFGVRLHGTSNPALFDQRVRAFSHGCIRVEDPLDLALHLIQDETWDAARIQSILDRRQEQWHALATPIPIYVSYWTAWVEEDGRIQFRDDLYGRDQALSDALAPDGMVEGRPGASSEAHNKPGCVAEIT